MVIRYDRLKKKDKKALKKLRAFQILCNKKLKEESDKK